MKITLKNKVYDTEKALGIWGTFGFEVNHTLYKTDEGDYFMHSENDEMESIQLMTSKEAQRILDEDKELCKQAEAEQMMNRQNQNAWFLN